MLAIKRSFLFPASLLALLLAGCSGSSDNSNEAPDMPGMPDMPAPPTPDPVSFSSFISTQINMTADNTDPVPVDDMEFSFSDSQDEYADLIGE